MSLGEGRPLALLPGVAPGVSGGVHGPHLAFGGGRSRTPPRSAPYGPWRGRKGGVGFPPRRRPPPPAAASPRSRPGGCGGRPMSQGRLGGCLPRGITCSERQVSGVSKPWGWPAAGHA